ncbi:polysaccharide deacetylase family protein [Streptomyces sp. NPDC058653]|uniref:polysaccharide deacetylase family protein n=1 Tax=Streptomyces sp. NPDC058653 TaxID=3346576 RepID=UPI00366043E2
MLTTAPALALAAHIVPAGTWLPGPRRAFFPGLAGIGRVDHVALTFDDGPDPRSTPLFLDRLDELHAHATFFVIGSALLRYPRLGREITRRGHEVAVHGWTHNRPWLPNPVRDVHELTRAARVVRAACGAPPLWYRPPYGILTGGRLLAARRAGLRPILWSAWGKDWTADATAASVLTNVRRDLRRGGTVLLHDSDRTSAPGCWHAALEALPDLVDGCRSEGMDVGPLAEHWSLTDDTDATDDHAESAPEQLPLP